MSESANFDRAQIGSRCGTADIVSSADTAIDDMNHNSSGQKVHPWVEPYYSHLEVLDFAAS